MVEWLGGILYTAATSYYFLLLPIAPSVSCSCLDALNTPSSKLPLSPNVFHCLPLSATRLSLLLNPHPKRSRQRENQAAEEADLVVQAKLVKMKDQRIPRLADLTMRPPLAGRKTIGNLDSHTNGLRFSTTKTNDIVDIMYANIQHAFFQPCQGEIMVIIHFHLKDPIMVGKKKTKDIQFLTEVMEASQALDTRSSMYDPDELESEQREREMRKALNNKFREFTNKVRGGPRHPHRRRLHHPTTPPPHHPTTPPPGQDRRLAPRLQLRVRHPLPRARLQRNAQP